MKTMKKYERSGVPCVYVNINNDPCDLLDSLRPLTLQEQIEKVTSISGKLEMTRRQELADLRGVIIDDPEDFESPLDSYKEPSLVDVVNAQEELNSKVAELKTSMSKSPEPVKSPQKEESKIDEASSAEQVKKA